jgi:site-specific DNA-methyltransferase (adenine-specific)
MFRSDRVHKQGAHNSGRWPANLIHDGSEEVVGLLNDAARFFYCCKASKADRDEGCEAIPERPKWKHEGHNHCLNSGFRMENGIATGPKADSSLGRNHHPTVKPTALMRYLCRLVTPPGGIVLDPFMGSGSTGKAAVLEGFRFIGIERDPGYFEIAKRRIQAAMDKRAEQLIPAA